MPSIKPDIGKKFESHESKTKRKAELQEKNLEFKGLLLKFMKKITMQVTKI
jgi:hypothetical protein